MIAFWVVIGVNVVLVVLGRGTQSGLQQPESLDALMSALRTSLTYEALAGLSGAAGSVVAILIIRQVMRYTRR